MTLVAIISAALIAAAVAVMLLRPDLYAKSAKAIWAILGVAATALLFVLTLGKVDRRKPEEAKETNPGKPGDEYASDDNFEDTTPVVVRPSVSGDLDSELSDFRRTTETDRGSE